MKKNILVYKLDNNGSYGMPDIYTFQDIIKVGIYNNILKARIFGAYSSPYHHIYGEEYVW